jgi:hypothetical protein
VPTCPTLPRRRAESLFRLTQPQARLEVCGHCGDSAAAEAVALRADLAPPRQCTLTVSRCCSCQQACVPCTFSHRCAMCHVYSNTYTATHVSKFTGLSGWKDHVDVGSCHGGPIIVGSAAVLGLRAMLCARQSPKMLQRCHVPQQHRSTFHIRSGSCHTLGCTGRTFECTDRTLGCTDRMLGSDERMLECTDRMWPNVVAHSKADARPLAYLACMHTLHSTNTVHIVPALHLACWIVRMWELVPARVPAAWVV